MDTVDSLGLGFNRQVCGTGKCCLVVIVQCQFQRLCDAGAPRELAVASRTLLRVCWKLGLGGRMGRPVVRLTLVTFLLLIVGKTSAGSLSNIPLTPDFALTLSWCCETDRPIDNYVFLDSPFERNRRHQRWGEKREEQGSSDRLVIKSKFSRSWGSPDTREAATAQS